MRRSWLVISILVLGCSGTETGNPPFAPGVGGDTGAPMGIAPPVGVERAWLSVGSVAFLPGAGCAPGDAGIAVRTEPGVLELRGSQRLETEPRLEEGDYCGLTLERVAWDGAEPAALGGATLVIEGVAGVDPVRVRSEATGTLTLVARDPFEMTPAEGPVLVFVDTTLLFNGIDLAGAAREPDGSIELSAESNPDLLAQLEAQLPGAIALFRDWDGDGELSTDERGFGQLAVGVP